MKNRTNYYAEYKTIQKIQKLLDKVDDLASSLSDNLKFEIENYHLEKHTLSHCTRWGLQAANEIIEDWPKITSKVEKEDRIFFL